MKYHITEYTREQARRHNVIVKHSDNKKKKLDVYNKQGKKIASIGALGYGDYPTFIQKYGLEYANKRRKAYKFRHESDRHTPGTNGWYADKLLW